MASACNHLQQWNIILERETRKVIRIEEQFQSGLWNEQSSLIIGEPIIQFLYKRNLTLQKVFYIVQ